MWAGVSPIPGADVAAASPSAAAEVTGGEPRVRTSSTACASFGRFCRTFARASGWAKYLKKGRSAARRSHRTADFGTRRPSRAQQRMRRATGVRRACDCACRRPKPLPTRAEALRQQVLRRNVGCRAATWGVVLQRGVPCCNVGCGAAASALAQLALRGLQPLALLGGLAPLRRQLVAQV